MKRTYSFQAPGKVTIAETVLVTITGKGTDEFRFTPAAPDSRWELVSAAADLTKIKNGRKAADGIYFNLAKPAPGDIELSFTTVLAYTGSPATKGTILALKPQCGGATLCEVKLEGLTAADTIEPIYDVANRKGGRLTGPVAFSTADLQRIRMLHLRLMGEGHRAAAWKIWKDAEILSHLDTNIRVGKDAETDIRESVRYDNSTGKARLHYLHGPDEQQRYLYGAFEGIYEGYYSHYVDSEFYVSTKASRFGYSIIGALTTEQGKQYITVPLPALATGYGAFSQSTAKYLTERKRIQLETPPGIKLNAALYECTDVGDNPCRTRSPIEAEIIREQNKIILIPEEAQTSSLWVLKAEVQEGKLSSPGFFKRVSYAFAQYHMMGKYPRWVFWFYFLTIVFGLIAGIVLFKRLGRLKHARVAKQKIERAEADTLRDLLQRDPAFRADDFRARCREIAHRIQHAWCAGDMRECRRYLSQGVYNRFRLQLKIMRELEKRQNAMADFNTLSLSIFARQRSGPYDALIVRLEAEARDVMVDITLSPAAAQAAAKKAPLSSFVEFYTFMRRRDAKTEKNTAMDTCSHCGTPFTAEGEITKCKSCGAVMGSGTFDWVLAEITQEVEYGKGKRFKMPTKEMSADRIEDRASFIFWREIMSQLTAKKDFILRDATPKFLERAGAHLPLTDIAVGAADMESYDDTLSPIRAQVRIKWSAKGPGDQEIRHRESVLSLVAEPQFEAGSGFAEHSCDTCGAPLPETDAEACAYCRSPIQRKNKDWLLDEIKTTVE